MDKVKKWKPGQLVTVNGIVCRMAKITDSRYTGCRYCAFYEDLKMCYNLCSRIHLYVCQTAKIPTDCYLKKL